MASSKVLSPYERADRWWTASKRRWRRLWRTRFNRCPWCRRRFKGPLASERHMRACPMRPNPGYMTCLRCGSRLPDGYRWCPRCGLKFPGNRLKVRGVR